MATLLANDIIELHALQLCTNLHTKLTDYEEVYNGSKVFLNL